MTHPRALRSLFALPLLVLAAAAPTASGDTGISLAPVELASATRLVPEPDTSLLAGGVLQPAPVPDAQTALPTTLADGGTQLTPRVYSQHEQFGGDGFSNGSSVQAEQQRQRPALGLGIAVPVN